MFWHMQVVSQHNQPLVLSPRGDIINSIFFMEFLFRDSIFIVIATILSAILTVIQRSWFRIYMKYIFRLYIINNIWINTGNKRLSIHIFMGSGLWRVHLHACAITCTCVHTHADICAYTHVCVYTVWLCLKINCPYFGEGNLGWEKWVLSHKQACWSCAIFLNNKKN